MTKKRLHNNGVYVCDFESTGDDLLDAQLANQLLSERGLLQPSPTMEQAMFNQASAFAATSADIYEKHLLKQPPNGGAMSPFVVNTAFSIELYIKTLALQHGKKLHGHEINKLFRKLPTVARAQVQKHLDRLASSSQWAGSVKTMQDLDDILREIDTAFVDWRYLHENVAKPLRISFAPTIFLAEILHSACAENL